MIKIRFHRQKKTRRNGLDRSFIFFQGLPKGTKYTAATGIMGVGIAGFFVPILPGRLLILTSVSIFAPARYIRHVGFHYRSIVFLQIISNHQRYIENNFRITPQIVRKSLQLKVKKRL